MIINRLKLNIYIISYLKNCMIPHFIRAALLDTLKKFILSLKIIF
jgi:hypothetical protein